ncbi:DUF4232 domain-containing protein [Pelagibacterium xiamenense]|uniref:DUF4232 domain-containing protein n=1 Tax=Pelagibacterium xiamenense TaxID=2901140 RepID=UPI001E6529E0|nr:DUF4232 domain-containing protein [Pelagibacterium xiamenense]MCD7061284.1 DUF4232 domain-containing protein [Pelagibacterium xiamenense]
MSEKSALRHLLGPAALVFVSLTGLPALSQDTTPLVPDCSSTNSNATDHPSYAQLICANPDWIETVREIHSKGDALTVELPDAWQSAFTAHQQAFPQFVSTCPTESEARTRCIETTLAQRLTDIADLAAHYDADTPACTSAELTVADSGLGDAGMSKSTQAYLFTYTGASSCRLLGYPAITVTDSNGALQWTVPVYSGTGNYFEFSGPPLPVTLSAANPQAWFAISASSGCDPASGAPGFTVAVAPPLSSDAMTSLDLPAATCDAVTVSPIGMRSMLEASIY